MNKNIRGLLILVVVVVIGGGCKKFLAPAPKDVVLESNFPKNYWDAEFMLRGAYQALQPLVEYQFVLGEMRGDWVTPGTGADNDIQELAYHRVTANNRYTEWQPYYDLINRANYVIKNVPRVPLDSNYFPPARRDQYLGEARFLRCWAYFNLVENFGSVPFVWDAVDDISKVDTLFRIAPTAQDRILDSVEVDLQRAYAACDFQIWVPNSFDAGLRVSYEQGQLRVRKQAVCELQAQVYLWRNKYTEAVNVCRNYSLYQALPGGMNASWFLNFSQNALPFAAEPLLRVNFSFAARETNSLMMLTSNDPASGGKYMVAPSTVAMKTYNPLYPDAISTTNTKDDIYRGFGYSYAGGAPYYNKPRSSAPVIWKFLGLAAVLPDSVNNVPPTIRAAYQSDYVPYINRCGDVSLLWAEAANRSGDKATAISNINAVRGRVGMPNATTPVTGADSISAGSSVEKIEDYILREWGLELGFEGRRWFTLMRMARHRGTAAAPNASYLSGVVLKRVPAAQQAAVGAVLADPKNWYLPYNATEVKLNPYLSK
ncbi:MAG: RagB/SusD family nutrient uptake outer membrane protein [Bacteroidetes bacterium]|nr:RagB/SusD family nutrient uptake outer membrane protein [Bacteroidota bacterium]